MQAFDELMLTRFLLQTAMRLLSLLNTGPIEVPWDEFNEEEIDTWNDWLDEWNSHIH